MYFLKCNLCGTIWYMDGDSKFQEPQPKFCPECGWRIWKDIPNYYSYTHKKIRFEYLNPTVEMIDIEDIAHALSNICRFTGHSIFHFSVAQHSISLSRLVSHENRPWALLHDAAEAYINDLATPLKNLIDGTYCKLEARIMEVICQKFGLSVEEPEEVKILDRILTINELKILVNPDFESENTYPQILEDITPWPPYISKREFLKRYEELFA
jgi:hypothetical protein